MCAGTSGPSREAGRCSRHILRQDRGGCKLYRVFICQSGPPGGGTASASDESVDPRLCKATAARKYDRVPSSISFSLFNLAMVLSSCACNYIIRCFIALIRQLQSHLKSSHSVDCIHLEQRLLCHLSVSK